MSSAFVCLGSNMGDAESHLLRARQALEAIPGVSISACSSLYRTEPQGRKDQPWFLNQVVRLECSESVTPESLLEDMLASELDLGRVRDAADRFGPRVIDMDLLLFDSETRETERLMLPHPRMAERAFVLVPLAEIAAEHRLPDGSIVEDLLKKLDYRLEDSAIFQ